MAHGLWNNRRPCRIADEATGQVSGSTQIRGRRDHDLAEPAWVERKRVHSHDQRQPRAGRGGCRDRQIAREDPGTANRRRRGEAVALCRRGDARGSASVNPAPSIRNRFCAGDTSAAQ